MPNQSAVSRVQANLDELFQGSLDSGNAYIKFQLGTDVQALMSMEQVQESVIIDAEQITALPSMPEATVGIMSSRDRVFCIFDLAQLLGLPLQSISPRQYQIIVLHTQNEPKIHVGLVVTQLQGIIRLLPDRIEPVGKNIPDQFKDYVWGIVAQESITLPILEFELILQALQANAAVY